MTAAAPIAPSPTLGRIMLMVLVPFGSGYFLSYLFRAVNAVVAPDLVDEIGLSASSLGLLTAAYLFAFAAFQLPLGILLDRFGPRRVQTVLLLVAATGAALFGIAESETALIAARAMIGLGFAGGLMASFKAVALWAPPGRMPLLNSWVMAFGGIGIMAASTPADMAVQEFGWRAVFIALACVTAVVALVIWVVVPRRGEASDAPREGLGQQLRALRTIYSDAEFWRVVPIITVMCGSHVAIQTLWAGPWLADVAGLDRDAVALTLTLMAAAFTVGIAPEGWTTPLWLLFAMTGQLGILGYPHVAEHFGTALAGRAGTAVNLLVFGTAFSIQYGIGAVLDRWPSDGGYPPEAYATAFGFVLGLAVVTFLWMILKKPKARRQALA